MPINISLLMPEGKNIDYNTAVCYMNLRYTPQESRTKAIGFSYRPRKHHNLSVEHATEYLSDLKKMNFWVNQSPEDVLKEYIFLFKDWFKDSPPSFNVMLLAGTLVRYVEEEPNIVKAYCEIKNMIPKITKIQRLVLAHFLYQTNNNNHCAIQARSIYTPPSLHYYKTQKEIFADAYKHGDSFVAGGSTDVTGVFGNWTPESKEFFSTFPYDTPGFLLKIHGRLLNGKAKDIPNKPAPLPGAIPVYF